MNLIQDLTSELTAIQARMDGALESIEHARSLQESWDHSAASLGRAAAQLAQLVGEAQTIVRDATAAVSILRRAHDVLEGADTAKLAASIREVHGRIRNSEDVLRAFADAFADETRAEQSRLASLVADGHAAADRRRLEVHAQTGKLIRDTDAARAATDKLARRQIQEHITVAGDRADKRREAAHDRTREFIRDTDAARATADEAARSELEQRITALQAKGEERQREADSRMRRIVLLAVVPAWVAVALLVALLAGCPG